MTRNRVDVLKRDNLLTNYILEHKGKENCVSAKEISSFLSKNGFYTKTRHINCIVSKIIKERCLPICSLNGKGYYWAKNKEDVLECIAHLKSRVLALEEHIEHLNNFIMEK